jgi:hypothetical protein
VTDRAELERHLRDRDRPPEVEEAIERLFAERRNLAMRLRPPYFAERRRLELVEVWRGEASDSIARRFARDDHEEALDSMLAHINGEGGA